MCMQAPGELVEVLAEKMLLAAQDLLQTTAELKRRAFLASAGRQLARAERTQSLVDLQGRVASLKSELAESEEVSGWNTSFWPLPQAFTEGQVPMTGG